MKFKFFVMALIAFILHSCVTTQSQVEKISQAESIRSLGEAYFASGNPTLALRELLKANSIYSKDPYTHNALGLAFLAKKRPDKAIEHFKKAISLKADYAPAINNLGSAYIAREEWDNAINTLVPLTKNILYATPHFAEANLGFAYFSKGDIINGETHYRNSLDLAPDYFVSLRGLSVLLRTKGDFKGSLANINRAIKIFPANGELYFQKAITLEKLYRFKGAKRAYLKAEELGDKDIKKEAAKALKRL